MYIIQEGFQSWILLLGRHHGKLLAGLAAIFLSTAFGSAQNKVGIAPDPAHPLSDPVLLGIGLVFQVGLVLPLVTALALVLTTTGQSGLPKRLADALSSQPLIQLADISYDIYLLHPLVSMFFLINVVHAWCTAVA